MQTLSDVSFSGTPYLALTSASGLTAYIQSSAWSALSSALPPAPTPTNNYLISNTDNASTISASASGVYPMVTPGGGIMGAGLSISLLDGIGPSSSLISSDILSGSASSDQIIWESNYLEYVKNNSNNFSFIEGHDTSYFNLNLNHTNIKFTNKTSDTIDNLKIEWG